MAGSCSKPTCAGVSRNGVGRFRIIVGRRVSNSAGWALDPERLCPRDPRRKTDKSDKQTNMVQLSHDSVASLQTCRRKQRPRESPVLLGGHSQAPGFCPVPVLRPYPQKDCSLCVETKKRR